MGIFTRRRAAAARAYDEGWQPGGSGVATILTRWLGDDGCAAEHAYGVTFTLASAPGATITAWFYATFAAPDDPGDFQVGWRCDYAFDSGGRRKPWRHTAYGMDDPDFYDDLSHAEATARWEAETLAATRREGPSIDDPSFLDWDGVPW